MASGNLFRTLGPSLNLGIQLGLRSADEARAEAREERLAKLQEQQGLLQQFQTLAQIGKAPKSLRGALFDTWTEQYQQTTGRPVNLETVSAWKKALTDTDESYNAMLGTIGEVLSGNLDQLNVRTLAPLVEADPLRAFEFAMKLNEQAQYQRALKDEQAGMGELPQPRQATSRPGPMQGPTRWRAAIEAAAQRHGLDPAILAAQVQIESGGNPLAVGAAGEQGLGQILPSTGRELGLLEPFDPAQNLDATARYLKQQLETFGSYPQALAAYNAGPGRVSSGQIPSSTQGYVNRVLGLARQYGGGEERGGLQSQLATLDAQIKRWMRVPGAQAQKRVNDLQQERTSLASRLKDLEGRDLQREKFAFEQQESILSPEGFQRRLALSQAEGRAKADVALENLRYTPQQQTQLQSLNDTLTSAEALREFGDEQITKWVGILRNPVERAKQLINPDPEFLEFQTTVDQLKAAMLFSRTEGGGGALTETELRALQGFVPTGSETGGPAQFRAKVDQIIRRLTSKLSTVEGLAKAKPGQAADILKQRRQEAAQARQAASALRTFGTTQPTEKSIDELTPDELRKLQ